MNIAEILSRQARELGDAPAIIDVRHGHDRVTSFSALESASARFAEQIARHGLGRGDAVLILHPVSAELYALLIAVFRIGAIGMVLDPSAGRSHIDQCLRMFPPKAFFASAAAHLLPLWIPTLRRIPLYLSSSVIPGALRLSLHAVGPQRSAIEPAAESDPVLITFTSGSTGAPKAAPRTHGFLVAQHRALQASLHHCAGSLDLTTLPVFVLANLASGITSVIPDADLKAPGRIRPWPVLHQFERLPITTMAASPSFVARLTEGCRISGRHFDQFKHVFMGGAPVFPEDLQHAHDAFPRAEITAVYGSTEAEPMAEVSFSSITTEDIAAMEHGRGLLGGRPVDSVSLRILHNQWGTPIPALDGAQFDALCLPTEAVGEIVVSGSHVLTGYLHGAGDLESKFRVDGVPWHRTGDLGWLDAHGRLWLMGRASATIHDARGVLYPFAIECAARHVPGVRHAAALSVANRRVLAIEAANPAAAERVRHQLQWAHIDEVRVLRSIPVDKRHNAKIDYVALRRRLAKT